jgi:16S rRNA U516 pseudouridylate synthase RsuA-like enzyme
MASERLQKIMAACGIASRRKAEEIIAAGRVTLNGKVVTEQGTKADPDGDLICMDGKPLKRRERLLYFMLHKPKGYVTTVSDPEGRPTVMELMKNCPERVYPVGRLDYSSEGLLLMTNDGALAQKLMKAGSHAPKTYLVKISGKPDERALARLRAGVAIELEDGTRVKTSPAISGGEDQAGAVGAAGVGYGAGEIPGADGGGSGEIEEPLKEVREQDRTDGTLTPRGAPRFYLLPCRGPRMRQVSSSS